MAPKISPKDKAMAKKGELNDDRAAAAAAAAEQEEAASWNAGVCLSLHSSCVDSHLLSLMLHCSVSDMR